MYPPINHFNMTRGMYWSDFSNLVYRNASPTHDIHIYYPLYNPHIVTITDTHYAKRRGITPTGHTYDDETRDSMVCNCGYDEGMIPLDSTEGKIDRDGKILVPQMRGAKSTIKQLLSCASLRPSLELDLLLNNNSKQYGYKERWYVA